MPRFAFQAKETEQYHICFGGPGISRSDERRFALGVLDAIFGGSTSSRLFREVREKRGLAYSVGSYSEQYVDGGMVAMYVGTREENVREACEIIGRELETLRDHGVSAEELERAKEHVKGRLVLGLEATGARMSRLARAILFGVPLLSLDEMLERIEQVSAEDVAELATELYDPERLSTACIGPDEEHFREATAAVSEALFRRHDPGRGLRGRGAHGLHRLRGRGGGRRPGACGACGSLPRRAALGGPRRGGRGGRLHDARGGCRERPRVPRRRRPCRGRHHRVRARRGARATPRRRRGTGSARGCSSPPTSRSEPC